MSMSYPFTLNLIGLFLLFVSFFFDNFIIPPLIVWHLIFWQVAFVFYGAMSLVVTVSSLMAKEAFEDRFLSKR